MSRIKKIHLVDKASLTRIILDMKRLVAAVLSLMLPVMVTVGLTGPCPCADSITEVPEVPSCCAAKARHLPEKDAGSGPCDHCPCDTCMCEQVTLSEASEWNAVVSSGVELAGTISDASCPLLFILPLTALSQEVPAVSNGPPGKRSLADLCVLLL